MESRERIKFDSKKTVLIYGESCPICSSTVAWIKEHEQKDAFKCCLVSRKTGKSGILLWKKQRACRRCNSFFPAKMFLPEKKRFP